MLGRFRLVPLTDKVLRVIVSMTLVCFSVPAGSQDATSTPAPLQPLTSALPVLKPQETVAPTPPPEGVQQEFIDRPEDVPARTVRVTIENVMPGDVTELEVMAANNQWAEPYKLKTNDTTFRFRVSPGLYSLRTRRAATTLPWGERTNFEVPFKEPKKVFPDGDSIEPKGNLSERLRFEWFPDVNNQAYRVKIFKKGELIRHVVTKQSWLSATLETNSRYSWTLEPMSGVNDPEGTKKAKKYHFVITKPRRELFPVEISLERKLHAINYQFELIQIREDESTSDPTIYESKEPIFRAELAPSEYELRVRSFFSNGEFSQWSAPRGFFVRLPKPLLTYPTPQLTIISDDEDKANVFLTWKRVEGAHRYRVMVYNSKNEEIFVTEVPTAEAKIQVPHNDEYTWTAAPLLKRETDRSPAAEAPRQAFIMTKYVRYQMDAAEEPSQFYSWGRGIYANTAYQAQNYDSHSFINQPIYATTGEVALGYWHRLSNLGLLGTFGATGIDIAGLQHLTKNYSANIGYRWKLEGTKRARAWFGYSGRETPEVRVDGALRTFNIQTIANAGPQLLGAFTNSFNDKWGYQLYGGLYYGAIPIKTPNGRPLESYATYFASAYVTYRWKPQIQGLLGYTYQLDEAGYQSDDRTGAPNHVRYSGHYLSLSAIFGLMEPKK